jgi:hypothetical protein
MKSIICKLTGVKGKPVKAHIIPKAFYEFPEQKEGVSKLYSNQQGTFSKKVPVGIYDSTFVTQEGEDIFNPLDNYAANLLLNKNMKLTEISKNGYIAGWTIEKYDYKLLKLFSLSVLWRAHASSRPEFSKVNIGPHEKQIKEMLLNSDPGDENHFSVIIAKWIDEGFGPVFMDPVRERYNGLNFYRIYCGRYVLLIKVDSRKTERPLYETQLAPDKPLILIARSLKQSKELPIMKKIAVQNML